MPLVSICIPTYNRASNLKRTIDSIVDKKEFLDGKVEVIISDNASFDNTKTICNEYNKYKNFHYYKNEKNVVDENFYLVLTKASGVYRKLQNDSFILTSDGISYLCEKVEKYKEEKPVLIFSTAALKLDLNEYVCDFYTAVQKISYWLTCLNILGFWEADIDKLEYNKKLFNKCLWQTDNVLRIMDSKNSIVICNKRLGTQLHIENKDVSYGIFRVFNNNFLSMLKKYVNDGKLSIATINDIEKQLLFEKFLYDLVNFKSGLCSNLNNESFENELYNYYSKKEYWSKFKRFYKKELVVRKIKESIKSIIKR